MRGKVNQRKEQGMETKTRQFREGVDWKMLTIDPCDPLDPRVEMRDAAGTVGSFDCWSDAAVFYAEHRNEDAGIFWHQGDAGWGEGCAPEFEDVRPMFSDDVVWWEEDYGNALREAEEGRA